MTQRPSRASSPFHILIKPAGPACNLKCDYCFYLEKQHLYPDAANVKTIMTSATLKKITEGIIQAHPPGVREIHIGWQGGEPTLCGLDFFKEAVEIQKKLLPEGVSIVNGFQTNGILIDDQWADFFRENRFLIGLSLDGPANMHDRFRKDLSGQGSFSRVMQALECLKEGKVEFNTLTSVQSHNADFPREVYQFLKEAGSTFMQFIPIVEFEEEGRDVSSRTVSAYQWGNFLSGVFDLWCQKDVGRIFVQHFDSFLGGYLGHPGGVCVFNARCGRSLVAEHNGDIYSCDHFVSPENFLGNVNQSDLVDLVDSSEQLEFGKRKTPTTNRCEKCRYLSLCYGGCPKNRHNLKGSSQNWLCQGYKDFFAHSEDIFQAMAEAVKKRIPASDYQRFLAPPSRNAPCPCGSGKKYKHCHGR